MSTRVDSYLQVGPHQSASDITNVTGTDRFLRTREKINLHGAKFARLVRNYQTGDGSKISDLQGMQNLETLPTLPFNVRGLSGGGAGNAVSTSTLDTDLDDMLLLGLGGSYSDTEGDTTDASDAGTGTTVNMDGSSALSQVRAWLIQGATSGRYLPRFQTSRTGAAVAICRALTQNDGTADTADEATVAYGGRVYFVSTSAPNRIPVFMDVDTTGVMRDIYRGVFIARTVFTLTPGGLLTVDFDVRFSDADFAQSSATPTYSAPTQGSEIKVWNSPAWFGSTQVMPKGPITITVENTLNQRDSQGGPQGNYGYSVDDVNVTVDGHIHLGGLTLEQARSYVTTLQGESTIDALFAAGYTPGAAAAFRLPALDVDAEVVADGARHAIHFMGKGTGAQPLQVAVY